MADNELEASAPGASCMKQYDQKYFDRWYRRSTIGVGHRDFIERKVKVAVAAAEYVLGRKVRTVLDVGCGEAPWRAILKRMRPSLKYQGFDSSDYAVERYGKRRNIRKGSLADLSYMGLEGPFDLVVCADVLHYVKSSEVRQGLVTMAQLLDGVAFIEAFTSADDIQGDHAEFQIRTPAVYKRLFADAGLLPLGLHLYTTPARAQDLVVLEKPGA